MISFQLRLREPREINSSWHEIFQSTPACKYKRRYFRGMFDDRIISRNPADFLFVCKISAPGVGRFGKTIFHRHAIIVTSGG